MAERYLKVDIDDERIVSIIDRLEKVKQELRECYMECHSLAVLVMKEEKADSGN